MRVAAHRRAKADQFSCGYICCSLCHWRLLLVLGNKPRGKFPVAWSHGVLSIFFPCLIPCQYIWNPCLICCESVVPCGSHMALLCISACPGGEYERDRSLFRAGLRLHAQPRPLLTKWFVRKHRAHTTGSSLKNGAAWEVPNAKCIPSHPNRVASVVTTVVFTIVYPQTIPSEVSAPACTPLRRACIRIYSLYTVNV